MKIWKIVVTGGPCGGKTTALDIMEKELTKKGFKVIIVPETATELISSGIKPNEIGDKIFHSLLVERSLNKDLTTEKASNCYNQNTVIIYDRGLMDFRAYISDEMFFEILAEHNLTEEEIINKYDAVFHLVTAADGAEDYYTVVNNKARTEGPEKALELDMKTRKIWEKHPNLKLIDNSTSFEEKIERLLNEVYVILGLPN